jgi:hypothetical protein
VLSEKLQMYYMIAVIVCLFIGTNGGIFVCMSNFELYNADIWPTTGQVDARYDVAVGLTPSCITELAVPRVADVVVRVNITTHGSQCTPSLIKVDMVLPMCQRRGHPESARLFDDPCDGSVERLYALVIVGWSMVIASVVGNALVLCVHVFLRRVEAAVEDTAYHKIASYNPV